MKYITLRINIKPEAQEDIEQIAEYIKDEIYDHGDKFNPVEDVFYNIQDTELEG